MELEQSPDYPDELFEKFDDSFEQIQEISRPSVSYWTDAWRRFKHNKVAILSLIMLMIILFLAIFGPMISEYEFQSLDAKSISKPPDSQHWFGTDDLGRDVYTRLWYGTRISLLIAFIAVAINVVIGVLYGGISGYFGGKVDMVMMRLIEVIWTIPTLLWVMMLMIVMGPGVKTIIIALAVTGWVSMARVVRGQVLQLRQMEYVYASKILGGKYKRIIIKHLIPNTMGLIIIILTFAIPGAIFTEAMLSYLGVGIPPPFASLGSMTNEGAKMILLKPYQLFYPALVLCIIMLSFNLLGDGLRDALDPKLRK